MVTNGRATLSVPPCDDCGGVPELLTVTLEDASTEWLCWQCLIKRVGVVLAQAANDVPEGTVAGD